ncbi:MAG: hypothetical protein J6T28_01245 [Paludibacteraceae bacterium]|nr:hypothetical protein [Paludibacteraceae bacterium]MBP5482404.1 hypothetical protein [Paludibacteraceae bacterium]
MKKIFFVLSVMGLLSLGFASCGDDDDEKDNTNNTENNEKKGDSSVSYRGAMVVTLSEESTFKNDTAECVCTLSEGALKLSFVDIKFAERMPVLKQIEVEEIPYEMESNGDYTFQGESIVPTYMGNPFSQYTLSTLNGNVKGDALSFTCVMGNYPISFSGTKK